MNVAKKMTKTVKTFVGFWSVEDARKNPRSIFVFGDNDIHVGKGGQATIRDEPNAFGIPTKKAPSLRESAFYTDDDFSDNVEKIDKAVVNLMNGILSPKYDNIYLPENGLGTGLAQLDTRAPRTFKYLLERVKEISG